ncbi:sulfate/molybdate ABC transporter ATP-binding protein [Sphingosinicella soli]|uniref:Sulfate transport system ATP-binding protein n=1 Tax=Sphingosinicella soli TaxID=333708 RepID=A0A7W7B236_9SPHN|nr:sulfate/molybdate ABC transporter ATP-binding protein [Sphingosinicella soli]MBB4631668.1 sulfate transport system ATP-binding protein [Sphingosinicella soli]
MSIRLENISKRFGAFTALGDVSLEARPGEFLALLGPSGSGKTTLLRIMAGLEFPDCGRVSFDGEDVTGLKVADRHVGFVFQHYALFRHMTVAENIAFGLNVRRRRDRPTRSAIDARVQELLDLVQLGSLGHRYPAQLSGGQRQRVALARALAVDPKLLLLDEPFGALDARVRKDLRRWLRELHDRMGLTSIFVTHDQEEALELADRVVVMDHGVIEQVATPLHIYNEPASAFVFDFVGESNRVPVVVARGKVLYLGQPLDVPAIGADGPSELFFRPHDAEIVKSDTGAIPALVAQVRPKGAGVRVEGKFIGIDRPFEIDVAAEDAPEPGRIIALKPGHPRLFPTHTHEDQA